MSAELELPGGRQTPSFVSLADQGQNAFGEVADPLAVRDVLSATTGVSLNLSGTINFSWRIALVVLQLSPSVNGSVATTSASVSFTDIDGDGLPDHVAKLPGEAFLRVKRNLAGDAGLLTAVALPQGGRFEFGYRREGNTPELPQSRWVLESMTRDAGALPADRGVSRYEERYEYADGWYDRNQRMFYAFGTVRTRRPNGSITTALFERRDYYKRGMQQSSMTVDALGRALASQANAIEHSDHPDMPAGGVSRFPYVFAEDSASYDAASGQALRRRVEYEYEYPNRYGNVARLTDYGDYDRQGDELRAVFSYDYSKQSYLRSLPTRIRVEDASGRLLRLREGVYGDKGQLEELRQYYAEGKASVSTLSWDRDYGQLLSITDPRGARMRWDYDPEFKTYVVAVAQDNPRLGGPSYLTRTVWDARQGKPIERIDANDRAMRYRYDGFGRLIELRSPYDTGPDPAVRYEYLTGSYPWTAISYNKISYDQADRSSIRTALTVDGLGRALQTAKDGEYREPNGTRRLGWNASGAAAYDAAGRIEAQGQPRFIEGTELPSLAPMRLATLTAYDELDRAVLQTLPDGAATAIAYRIEGGSSLRRATDPLGNVSERRSDARGNAVAEARYDRGGALLTSARYEYDVLGQMLKAIDARGAAVAVGYDLLGRRVSLESPDSGRVELEYDESGNVARKTDAALRSRGEAIRYEYDGLNRLIKVDYPRSKDTSYEYGGSDAASKAANAAGRLTRRTDQSGTVSYAYGLLGETRGMSRTLTRVTPLAAPESASFGYAWDYLGRMSAIVYPDGEELRYGYDYGGQIKSVTGRHHGLTTNYVADIAYDEFGQRTYIEYGNGARTSYAYDESRRWLDTIRTESGSRVLQDMRYSFDAVGNVLGYDNQAGSYATSQRYAYDGLYQLVRAEGTTTKREFGLIDYESRYSQDFRFDEIGNLIEKASRHTVSPKKEIGDELNYTLGYSYYEGKSRQAERIGDIYYRYDLNGNVTAARKGGHASASPPSAQLYREGETRYTDYGFGLVRRDDPQGGSGSVWARSYEWDEENRLIKSVEGERTVEYRYGDDGQRSSKQSGRSETLYFDSLWQATDNAFGFMQSKHVYVGQHRVATRLNEKGKENAHYEAVNTYYYHSDHLGSAQLVSDYRGLEYERVEYAPYGELWVEKTQGGVHAMPFRFTGKELDEETGLYYYGARYLDPKTSRWLSTDPALGEYIPAAPVNDEARQRNENLPGLGGVYNLVNLHVYHYAGNNPIKYVDPDGRTLDDGGGGGAATGSREYKPDIRNIIKVGDSHLDVQEKVPEGYDAIWITGVEVSVGASASIGSAGGLIQGGVLGVMFTNCNTGDYFEATFATLVNEIEGTSFSMGIGLSIWGGFGLIKSGSSSSEIAASFARDQGYSVGGSVLFIGGSKSESSKWIITQINLGASKGVPGALAATRGGMSLLGAIR